MPWIGITGHSNLSARTMALVRRDLGRELLRCPGPLVGVSCLAYGADQIFAQAVLELGGILEAVLPATDYRERKVHPHNVPQFDELVGRARSVHTMPFERSSRAAYMAASEHVLTTVQEMFAVWDGKPASGHGGTADVVREAERAGLPVTVIWPEGAERDDPL